MKPKVIIKTRNPINRTLAACKCSRHGKTEKANRTKEKVALKKERFLEVSLLIRNF